MTFSNLTRVVGGVFGILLLIPFISFAQSDEASFSGAGQELAQLNVSEAAVVGNTAEMLTISFVLENIGSVPQSDIRYGAELVAVTAGTQVTADAVVASETDSLAAGAEAARVIEYPLSGIAPGSYEVWVTARTTGGMVLGLARAGAVTVASSDAVSFMTETCKLTIGESDTTYHLAQGVDVSADESLQLECTVKNYGTEAKVVTPVFETFKRSVFGEKVNVDYGVVTPESFAAGEEKTLTFNLPKATAPQAYEIKVALTEEGSTEIISNHVATHYVLRGASATIQSVNFDKASYDAGEEIHFTMFWTGPADAFFDSRSGTGTALVGNVSAKIVVTDESGASCTAPITEVVTPGEVSITTVAATDCANPKATISLVDQSGQVLDERSIEVVEEEVGTANDGAGSEGKNPYMLITFIALALAALAVLMAVTRHKKVDFSDAAKVLVLTVMTAGALFGGAHDAEAATWNHRWSNSEGVHNHSVTVNTNRTVYAPGETISLSSMIRNADCANNSIPIHSLIATLQGTTITLSQNTANTVGDRYGSGTFTAPAAAGTYTIALRMSVLGQHSYANINITVVVPAVAAVGSFDSVTPSTCSVAGWAYDADSSASSIAVHVYRDASAFGGGTFVTACSANQARADVNAAYGISGNHGFNCALPASYQGTGNHNLYIHAIDTNGSPNNVIGGSPRALNCLPPPPPPPPPPPAPSASISATGCNIPVGGSTCGGTVTWTIDYATTPNVYNSTAGASYSSVASGNNQPITLTHGTTTLQARDGSAVIGTATALVGAGCAGGSGWNGSSCAATPAFGSLNTTGCSIALGNSSCQGTINSWSITGASNPNIYNDTTNAQLYAIANGGPVNITLPRGNTTILARDGSSELDREVLQAICNVTTAPTWNGTECTNVPAPLPPQIDLDLDKEIVRSGETAVITSEITASYPTECTLQGATAAPIVFTHSGSPATATYTHTTRPLTAAQQIVLTCEPDPAIVGVSSASREDRINVVPSVQEI